MDGLPVTIRLLDPPLHEFLPDGDMEEVGRFMIDGGRGEGSKCLDQGLLNGSDPTRCSLPNCRCARRWQGMPKSLWSR